MEEFGTLDDDIFEKVKKPDSDQQFYAAMECEPEWFLHRNKISSNDIIVQKYKADNFYLKGNYKEAISFYKIYMKNCPNINLPAKRDCLEGICRSYMALQSHCFAIKFATELQQLSSTFDSHSVGLSLLFDSSMCAGKYQESVAYGQKLITLHCSNSDLWIKLGYAYSRLYKIPLKNTSKLLDFKSNDINIKCFSTDHFLSCDCKDIPETKTTNLDTSKGIHLVTTCLLHCEFLLKSVENTAIGFAFDQNQICQKKIIMDLKDLIKTWEDLNKLRERVRRLHIHTYKYEGESINEEFIDRASSKFENKEQVNFVLQYVDGKTFEEKWLLMKNWQTS